MKPDIKCGMQAEIRINPSFSAPRIIMETDEEEFLEASKFGSTHSLLAQNGDSRNNAACTSSIENLSSERSHLETQRLSPPLPTLMPSQLRPYSNSVCTSLLIPDMPKRSQMHRASDGLLMSDTLREQHEKRTQVRHSSVVDQDLYWKANEARHRSNVLTTPLASYIFVFISVLFTFSIVFIVYLMISSMTYKGKMQHALSHNFNNTNFNPTTSNFPTQKMAADQVQILTYNTTNE